MVAQRLDELYPDFYASFVEILPTFEWQIELLEDWMKCRQYVTKQGGSYAATGLSEADEQWLTSLSIKFKTVRYPVA